MIRIYKEKDYEAMSRRAANVIAAEIIRKPNCVLGLATGSTPIGTYKRLIEMYNSDDISFNEVTTVNLDEYKGLTGDHDQSYRYFMNTNLFDHVNIDKSRELAVAFDISSIPAIMYIPVKGEPRMTLGSRSKDKFKKEIETYLLK